MGLKGARCGDAAIAEWHANYIVNHGQASVEDVLKLIEMVCARARKQYGIELSHRLEVW